MSKGFLLVVSGPSGIGKGTICNRILKNDKNLIFSISATTRKPRYREKHGKNYFFIEEADFKEKIKNNEFLEYAKVHNNFYGTPKDFVLDRIDDGKVVILEIDVQGALQVKKAYPEAVLMFLVPPSMKELKNRITKRGTETKEEIDIRYNNAFKEMNFIEEYDYLVINDRIEYAVEKTKAIITAEKLKVERNKDILNEIAD